MNISSKVLACIGEIQESIKTHIEQRIDDGLIEDVKPSIASILRKHKLLVVYRNEVIQNMTPYEAAYLQITLDEICVTNDICIIWEDIELEYLRACTNKPERSIDRQHIEITPGISI